MTIDDTIAGCTSGTAMPAAALANGALAHAFELDSLTRPGAGAHPGATVLPPGLAIVLVIRRENGVLKRLRATPLPAPVYIAAVLLTTLIAFAVMAACLIALGMILFGASFLVVVAMHAVLYALAGRANRDLLGAVLRLLPWTLPGATLILVAGFTDGARTWLWLAAIVYTYVGALLVASRGWQLHLSHLAERHGLVLIIAIGEAFISIGIGAAGIRIGLREIVAAILGLLVATSFWLAYFDYFSIRSERILGDREGAERVTLARHVYSYAHLPMIVGIVLFAFAMKTIVGHAGEELDWATAFALCGGSALYLLTYSAIRIRIEGRLAVSRGRFAAALVLLLVLPLATVMPGVAALALVTAVWVTLHAYELVWWREARAESRSMLASS